MRGCMHAFGPSCGGRQEELINESGCARGEAYLGYRMRQKARARAPQVCLCASVPLARLTSPGLIGSGVAGRAVTAKGAIVHCYIVRAQPGDAVPTLDEGSVRRRCC